jgi:type IV secretion system protein VirB11
MVPDASRSSVSAASGSLPPEMAEAPEILPTETVTTALSSPKLPCAAPGALEWALAALRPWLSDPAVTEWCLYTPGEAFVERDRQWTRVAVPFATFDWCVRLAKLVGNATRQRIDEGAPLLSAGLPGGERVQFAIPPAAARGHVAIAIRRPSQVATSVQQMVARGIFLRTRRASRERPAVDRQLLAHLEAGEFGEFMRLAVLARKNILVSGPTGSGKTTWTKALIAEIPRAERLITIEDAAELSLDSHPNHVRLYYSKDGQGRSRVTPKELLEACLRLRPDRILLAELRSEEAFYYLRTIASGHPGSITSIHGGSCELAFEQLMLMVRQSPGGQGLTRDDIHALVRRIVDVVIQFAFDGGQRYINEIHFN